MKSKGEKYIRGYRLYREELENKISDLKMRVSDLERMMELMIGKVLDMVESKGGKK
tara:strand:- start:375 stop:542 length:168 start_codon:yes stop_codon:yes gene_type:complete